MKVTGIIAEYNPFHNGHHFHVEQTRKVTGCDFVVAVMSGHFTQRGEPALFDKWSRAEMAVHGGVDVVFELPYVYAVRSAQYFATGGVRLLEALGVVTQLAFGTECDDLATLTALAKAHERLEVPGRLRQHMARGLTYAAGLGRALAQTTGIDEAVIASPNNILAVEYLRAIARFAPNLRPVAIRRHQAGHHDRTIENPVASATAIRNALAAGDIQAALRTLPTASRQITEALLAEGGGPVFEEAFCRLVLAKLRLGSCQELAGIAGLGEGLHNRLKDAARESTSLATLLDTVKTRRYPRTRLQRSLIHLLLGITRQSLEYFDESGPLYARVLAFNARGSELLRAIERQHAIPLVVKTAQYLNTKQRDSGRLTPLQTMLALDTKASDLYALSVPELRHGSGGWDFLRSPRRISAPPSDV